jgi:N utilization substance protein B
MVGMGIINGRSDARVMLLQSLCEADIAAHSIMLILDRKMDTFTISGEVARFSRIIAREICDNYTSIDATIKRYATLRPVIELSTIDRNVLRLAIAEITISDDVPAAVIINEAVEMARNFGSEESFKFVNGVLGTFYKCKQLNME